MRRLAEVANLMLDAGIILVVAAAELTQDDLEVIKTPVELDGSRPSGPATASPPTCRWTCIFPAGPCRKRWTGSRPTCRKGNDFCSMMGASNVLAVGGGRAAPGAPGHHDLLRRRRIGGVLREKADQSPVSSADEAAHEILVDGLRQLDPRTPVVSEESAAEGYHVRHRAGDGSGWCIADGTKEFIKHRAEFTVNVALIEEGEPVLGVALAPALELLYWAVKDGGACGESGRLAQRQHLLHRARAGDAAHGGREPVPPWSPELQEYQHVRSAAGSRRGARSSSAGWRRKGDIYPRLGPTMEWDVAAGDCVYRQLARHGECPRPSRQQARPAQPQLRHRPVSAPARSPTRTKSYSAAVLWFTGLSGSGKSTIATRVHQELERRARRWSTSTATRFWA